MFALYWRICRTTIYLPSQFCMRLLSGQRELTSAWLCRERHMVVSDTMLRSASPNAACREGRHSRGSSVPTRAEHDREIDKFSKLLERIDHPWRVPTRKFQRFPRSLLAVSSHCCYCASKSSQKLRKLVNFCNSDCMKPWKPPRVQRLCFKYEKTFVFQGRSGGGTLRKFYHELFPKR